MIPAIICNPAVHSYRYDVTDFPRWRWLFCIELWIGNPSSADDKTVRWRIRRVFYIFLLWPSHFVKWPLAVVAWCWAGLTCIDYIHLYSICIVLDAALVHIHCHRLLHVPEAPFWSFLFEVLKNDWHVFFICMSCFFLSILLMVLTGWCFETADIELKPPEST